MTGRWTKLIRHRDGTLDYYSECDHKWMRKVKNVPTNDIAKMSNEEQRCVFKFFARHRKSKGDCVNG